MKSKHCVAELFNANPSKLNDEALIQSALVNAAENAGATLLNVYTHSFKPQGVTGFALLAESHISIHTWPEFCFASLDAFTCGDSAYPEIACSYLAEIFESKGYSLNIIDRISPKSLSKNYM